ncbi:exodeoxyribonuclease VII large subunit [Erysipelotrichaceae bacterium RD49]|nr:exodeoxyribonuclease VII large subunit [Erysipelotrichaceae bacterium RD49]
MQTLRVGELVAKVKAYIQRGVNLSGAYISGELSNVKYVNGHCYFDLKDDQGQLSCTLWKTQAAKAGFLLEDGLAVLVHGTLNVYEKRGTLQLNVDHIEPAGLGALYLEFEKRKQQLAAAGCFAQWRKKPKPAEINSIAIVTGKTTAALQDALKTIKARWPLLKVKFFNAPVQGQEAPPKIIRALQEADDSGVDAVLLIRGGGSFEDLFCFNDPGIVHALNAMKTYTVTGIGHEIDTSLADLAADHMAVTPTAAAQWVTLDQQEVKARLAALQRQLIQGTQNIFDTNTQRLMYLQASPVLANPQNWIDGRKNRQQILLQQLVRLSSTRFHAVENQLAFLKGVLVQSMNDHLINTERRLQGLSNQMMIHSPMGQLKLSWMQLSRMEQAMQTSTSHHLKTSASQLDKLEAMLKALSPQAILERGYAIVTLEGKPVKEAAALKMEDAISLQFAKGFATASITSLNPDPKTTLDPANGHSTL